MTNNFVRVIATISAAMLLSACGGGNDQANYATDSSGPSMAMPGLDKSSGDYSPTTAATEQAIIRNGDLALEVSDAAKTVDEVRTLITSKDGRIESSSLSTESGNSGPSAYMVARVPEAKLDEVIAAVSELGQRTSLNINTTDVTLQVVDLRARIDALTISRDRLMDLMAQATTTADLLAAEQALAQRQSELDAFQSQLDYLDAQVAQSTLSIQIFSDSTSITSGLAGVGPTLTQALRNFLQAFESVILFIGTAIPWILVLAIFYFAIKSALSWIRKRKLKKTNQI